MKNTSVLILAGGESSRMGQPKAFLNYDEGNTFLEKIVREYIKAGISKIILVINPTSHGIQDKLAVSSIIEKISVIYNKNPERGRLFSIKLGLTKLDKTDHCFIQNIDNPFISSELIKRMIPLIENESYVSPTYNRKGGHPVLLSNTICRHIININDPSATLRTILRNFNKVVMPANKEVLININTEEDFYNYFSEGPSDK